MAKSLKDIVKGVKSSKTDAGKLGKDPGVDYEPKPGDEQKFVKKHSVEKHDDRVGNGEHVYKGGTKEAPYNKQKEGVYEAKEAEDAQCNNTPKGKSCPVHGMAECMSVKPIKEEELDEMGIRPLSRAATKYKDNPKSYATNSPKAYRKPWETSKADSRKEIENLSKGISVKKLTAGKAKGIKEEDQIDEVLTKSTTAGETIHDFVHSKNPKFAGKSKEKRKEMALAAYYAKQRNEEVEEAYAVQPLLGGDIAKHKTNDTGEEIDMVRTELKAIANKAMHMLASMPKDVHIEPWVQAKIAQAKEMIGSVHDYCIYGDHNKPEEDEQNDTPMSTPTMFPNMASDNAAGINV